MDFGRYPLFWWPMVICIHKPPHRLQLQILRNCLDLKKAITTAVPFLAISPDARHAALGDAGVATSPDANSTYWNAGKLVFYDKAYGVSGSYTPWLGKIVNDMSIFYLTGFYKITKEQSINVSMKYFDLGDITFNTGPNQIDIIGEFHPREFAFDASYSRKLSENLGVGPYRSIYPFKPYRIIRRNQRSH